MTTQYGYAPDDVWQPEVGDTVYFYNGQEMTVFAIDNTYSHWPMFMLSNGFWYFLPELSEKDPTAETV